MTICLNEIFMTFDLRYNDENTSQTHAFDLRHNNETNAPFVKYHIKKEITMISLLISLMLFFTSCTNSTTKQVTQTVYNDTCWIYLDLEEHQNMEAIIAGKLIEYIPPYDNSKLGDEKIWDYELKTQDGYKVPLNKTQSLDVEKFKDKDVFIKATIKHGIIFGEVNTANMQGYRIDPVEIYLNEKGYGNTLTERKIRIDLSKFNDEGYRVRTDGEKSSTSYEFCIPANDSILSVVKAIDPTASEMKSSKGRSDCGDMEWLVISNTHQKNFKDVIRKLSELSYIRKITETFWE